VAGVVERRQTLPVLSNVLLNLDGNHLSITGTDLEVELVGRVRSRAGEAASHGAGAQAGGYLQVLPEGAEIEFRSAMARRRCAAAAAASPWRPCRRGNSPTSKTASARTSFTLKQGSCDA
jgi:DNA polymerase-3 subunit beta